jgi:hypothetical protein
MTSNLSESELTVFKEWLKGQLAYGATTVIFTKKDGTERVMQCTISTALVPAEIIVEGVEPKKEKKVNEDVCPVYDLEAKSWRSFRWDSVNSVEFTIGKEDGRPVEV